MPKVTLQQFKKIIEHDVLAKNTCIEIEFCIDGDPEYTSCWLGKMPDDKIAKRDLYWFGLVADGSQAYEFNTAEEFITAPVFHGSCLSDLWSQVTIKAIDSCDVEYRLPYYLK